MRVRTSRFVHFTPDERSRKKVGSNKPLFSWWLLSLNEEYSELQYTEPALINLKPIKPFFQTYTVLVSLADNEG